MKEKLKKYLYLFLALIVLGGMSFFVLKTKVINGILGVFNLPLWKTASLVEKKVKKIREEYKILAQWNDQLKVLQQKLIILKSELARCEEELRLYKNIKKFYTVSAWLKYPKIPARIIYKPLDPFAGVIYIDQGSDKGITPEMPVLAAVGGKAVALIGQVVEVHRTWSKVILLTHPSFAADVKVVQSGTRGILKGEGQNHCLIEYLPIAAQVKPGDAVVTSGQDALFPPDLFIGTITSVKRDPVQSVFKVAEVKPAVDFYDLELVFVLIKTPEIPL